MNKFPNVMAPLRYLTIASCSLLLSRFDRTLRKIQLNTLMNDMNRFRAENITAIEILSIVKRPKGPNTETGFEKLQFLAFDAPKLRYIFHEIHTYVLPHTIKENGRKFLITEDVPLNASYLKCVCNMIYVKIKVLHAALTDVERINLVKRFNNPKDNLMIIIIMYQVSAQRVNLDPCCCRAIVDTPAVNAPSEMITVTEYF